MYSSIWIDLGLVLWRELGLRSDLSILKDMSRRNISRGEVLVVDSSSSTTNVSDTCVGPSLLF